MYTVKQFEIAKPANVVYSNFRLKDHNVLYALGYTFKAGKVGKNSIFWNDKGEAFSRDIKGHKTKCNKIEDDRK